jgi:hypothetical protein
VVRRELQIRRTEAEYPAMVRISIAITAVRDIDNTISQGQRATLKLLFRIEHHRTVAAARAESGHGGAHDNRAVIAFSARANVQSMNSMNVIRSFMGKSIHIERSVCQIDDRRAGDAQFRHYLRKAAITITKILVGGRCRRA